MKKHFQYWGAAYLLMILFIGSFVGQAIYQLHYVGDTSADFWTEVFANWQSEWLQLLIQSIALLALGHRIFKADKADIEEIQKDVKDIKQLLKNK